MLTITNCEIQIKCKTITMIEFNHIPENAFATEQEFRRDLLALDLRLSLLVGATQSFKYESLLKPVPSTFLKEDGEIDIQKLRNILSELPEISPKIEQLDNESIKLLTSACFNVNHKLRLISISDLQSAVLGRVDLTSNPHWAFQVDYSPGRKAAWEKTKGDRQTFFAFHGSRFENFHAILNLGLHQHLNKTSLFGEGIYLSTEQSMSLQYSPCGQGWNKSQLGSQLSILALCEVIDHPDVKRKGRSKAIPEKYILVTNNELVCLRYLLIYKRPKVIKKVSCFWESNKFSILLVVYLLFLAAIGFLKK